MNTSQSHSSLPLKAIAANSPKSIKCTCYPLVMGVLEVYSILRHSGSGSTFYEFNYASASSNTKVIPHVYQPGSARRMSFKPDQFFLDDGSWTRPPDGSDARFKTLYRSWRLQLFKSLIYSRWNTTLAEDKKVAMRKDRGHTLLHCTLHIIPVGTAMSFVILNATQHYVGGELAGPQGQDA